MQAEQRGGGGGLCQWEEGGGCRQGRRERGTFRQGNGGSNCTEEGRGGEVRRAAMYGQGKRCGGWL